MSLKDIEKLREKVDKDPNSKLFVPLADEYRKEGLLDEAINVLLSGLEKQPAYTSARVSLGKIYLEKGMMTEAKAEFENVVKIIPDNLYAQKKLAELYRDSGDRGQAIRAYRNVLKLNALDEESLSSLQDLETEAPEKKAPEAVSLPQAAVPEAEELPEPVHDDIAFPAYAASEAVPVHSEEELNSFKEAIFGGKADTEETVAGKLDAVEEPIEVIEEKEAEEEISLVDTAEEMPAVETHEVEEEEISPEGITEEAVGEISVGEYQEDSDEELSVAEMPEDEEEDISLVDDVDYALGEEALQAPEMPQTVFMAKEPQVLPEIEEAFSPSEPARENSRETFEEAERLISAGNFAGALSVYRGMLSRNPEDRKTLQRVEELRSLLKMMGKDKEVLIEQMNSFLDVIRKRRDEFLRSS